MLLISLSVLVVFAMTSGQLYLTLAVALIQPMSRRLLMQFLLVEMRIQCTVCSCLWLVCCVAKPFLLIVVLRCMYHLFSSLTLFR